MKLKPVITEKSLNDAKNGRYTFWVDPKMDKFGIKTMVGDVFGVNVVTVKTVNIRGGRTRTYRGRIRITKGKKKAVVTLKKDQKIDLFEEKKGKKK